MLESLRNVHQRRIDGVADLESHLSFRFAVLSRLLDRHMARLLARHDLTLSAYRILAVLNAFGELSAADIARISVVDKGLISRRLADLHAAGLVSQREDPRRRRRRLLTLSEAGRQRFADLQPAVLARKAGLDAVLCERDRESIDRAIAALTRFVAEDLDGDSAPLPPTTEEAHV